MQRRFIPLMLLLLSCAISSASRAQAPQQFNYQAVIRDDHGQPMANKTIQLRLRIRNGGANGAAKYTEVRTVTTNEFGLVTVPINGPGADLQQGSIGLVEWATGNVFLQVEADHDKDGSFTDLGATQILSAPYAMFARPQGDAAGDLGGKYPNPSVNKLQGQALDLSAQKYHGYTLKWDQVNNKWITGKDEDGGPDFYFKASKNSQEGIAFKAFPTNFIHLLNQNPLIDWVMKAFNTLHFPREESDPYGVFDDSVFTAPVAGYYEFEVVLRFRRVHSSQFAENSKTIVPLYPASCILYAFKNGQVAIYSWDFYKNADEADLRPLLLRTTQFLQQGDKMTFKFTHTSENGNPAVLGYNKSTATSWNDPPNYEGLYIIGRKLR